MKKLYQTSFRKNHTRFLFNILNSFQDDSPKIELEGDKDYLHPDSLKEEVQALMNFKKQFELGAGSPAANPNTPGTNTFSEAQKAAGVRLNRAKEEAKEFGEAAKNKMQAIKDKILSVGDGLLGMADEKLSEIIDPAEYKNYVRYRIILGHNKKEDIMAIRNLFDYYQVHKITPFLKESLESSDAGRQKSAINSILSLSDNLYPWVDGDFAERTITLRAGLKGTPEEKDAAIQFILKRFTPTVGAQSETEIEALKTNMVQYGPNGKKQRPEHEFVKGIYDDEIALSIGLYYYQDDNETTRGETNTLPTENLEGISPKALENLCVHRGSHINLSGLLKEKNGFWGVREAILTPTYHNRGRIVRILADYVYRDYDPSLPVEKRHKNKVDVPDWLRGGYETMLVEKKEEIIDAYEEKLRKLKEIKSFDQEKARSEVLETSALKDSIAFSSDNMMKLSTNSLLKKYKDGRTPLDVYEDKKDRLPTIEKFDRVLLLGSVSTLTPRVILKEREPSDNPNDLYISDLPKQVRNDYRYYVTGLDGVTSDKDLSRNLRTHYKKALANQNEGKDYELDALENPLTKYFIERLDDMGSKRILLGINEMSLEEATLLCKTFTSRGDRLEFPALKNIKTEVLSYLMENAQFTMRVHPSLMIKIKGFEEKRPNVEEVGTQVIEMMENFETKVEKKKLGSLSQKLVDALKETAGKKQAAIDGILKRPADFPWGASYKARLQGTPTEREAAIQEILNNETLHPKLVDALKETAGKKQAAIDGILKRTADFPWGASYKARLQGAPTEREAAIQEILNKDSQ